MRLWPILIYLLLAGPAQAQETARLGVFGTVEGVAPLTIAGLEIALEDSAPIISILGPQGAIAKGDTLAIVLVLTDDGFVAERILEFYPVVGPVSDVVGDTAMIMGSAVHIPPDARIKKGQWLAISGMWSGDKAITTNFRRFGGGIAQVAGVVDQESSTVGGTKLFGTPPMDAGYGDDLWILSGTADGEGLQVRLTSKGVFGKSVDIALWQGYASAPIASQTYEIHGSGLVGTARDAQMPGVGTLIARCVHKGRVIDKPIAGMEAAFDALGCATRIRAE